MESVFKILGRAALISTCLAVSGCDLEPKWTRVCDEWKVTVKPNTPPPNRQDRKCEAWVVKCKAGLFDSDQCDAAAKPPAGETE